MKIEIISGSAREGRQSHQVALTLLDLLEEKENIEIGLLDIKAYGFPLLDHTYSTHPNPTAPMQEFSNRLKEADAFIIVSPEHNGSYSGALKNTMDYFYKEYENKYFGIVTVSAGALGGTHAMKNIQQYLLHIKGNVFHSGLITPKVQELYKDGSLIDESYQKRMNRFLDQYLEYIKK